MSVVMAEERLRIQQFVFQKDAKLALVSIIYTYCIIFIPILFRLVGS